MTPHQNAHRTVNAARISYLSSPSVSSLEPFHTLLNSIVLVATLYGVSCLKLTRGERFGMLLCQCTVRLEIDRWSGAGLGSA